MFRRGLACLVLALTAAVALGTAPALAQPDAVTVGVGDQNLYSLDLGTGVATLIGATGADDIRAIAFAPDGTLYGVDEHFGAGNVDELVTIDPSTGASTVVGLLGFDVQNTGLTFGVDGRMWLSDSQNPRLFEVDPATGAATLVGSTTGFFISGLAGACDGRILGAGLNPSTSDFELVSLDTSTGAATSVGSFGIGVSNADIAFDYASQTLYGVEQNDSIFTIDPATGAATVVGTIVDPGGQLTHNLAIDPITCPPPPPAPLAPPPEPVVVTPAFTG